MRCILTRMMLRGLTRCAGMHAERSRKAAEASEEAAAVPAAA